VAAICCERDVWRTHAPLLEVSQPTQEGGASPLQMGVGGSTKSAEATETHQGPVLSTQTLRLPISELLILG
jgi:hypothetical protein